MLHVWRNTVLSSALWVWEPLSTICRISLRTVESFHPALSCPVKFNGKSPYCLKLVQTLSGFLSKQISRDVDFTSWKLNKALKDLVQMANDRFWLRQIRNSRHQDDFQAKPSCSGGNETSWEMFWCVKPFCPADNTTYMTHPHVLLSWKGKWPHTHNKNKLKTVIRNVFVPNIAKKKTQKGVKSWGIRLKKMWRDILWLETANVGKRTQRTHLLEKQTCAILPWLHVT